MRRELVLQFQDPPVQQERLLRFQGQRVRRELVRPFLHSRTGPFDPFLHLHRFARIPWVLELLLRLYMRHLEFLSLLCLLAGRWVLEL